MYTVYCYAYYFTIKETKVGNSGLSVTTRDGISRGTSILENAGLLLLLVAPICLLEECLHFILGSMNDYFLLIVTGVGEEKINGKSLNPLQFLFALLGSNHKVQISPQ